MPTRRIRYLQHVPFEGPAALTDWAISRGHLLEGTRSYAGEAMPALHALDGLVVLGGPMNADEEDKYPWLGEEKRLISRCVEGGIPVLGICLGAQLIARTAGARVYPGSHKEIGWFSVHAIHGMEADEFSFGTTFVPLHWHGDTFDIPSGARHLTRSEGVAHQSFAIGERVLALQFHMEATQDSVSQLLTHAASDIDSPRGLYQMEPNRISREAPAHLASNHQLLAEVLDRLFAKAPHRGS